MTFIRTIRTVKSDAPEYKNLVFQSTNGGPYVELWWRRKDMAEPSIESGFTTADGIEKWEVAVACLQAAVAEAKSWMAYPPWGESINGA